MMSRCCWLIHPEIEIRSSRNGSKPKHIGSGYNLQQCQAPSKHSQTAASQGDPVFGHYEGQFVASYKFALLLVLADLSVEKRSVEKGDDSGSPLTLDTGDIGEKFVQYYWRQTIPYPAGSKARVLQQNIGKQAAVLNIVRAARERHGDSLAGVMKQPAIWTELRRKAAAVVRTMPLWKLQTVGRERLDFLYENAEGSKTIELRPGVAYCFRQIPPADLRPSPSGTFGSRT